MRLKVAGFVAAVFSLVAAQSAFAADMPAKAPVYKVPMAAGTSWTGLYVNGGIGYGMWAADTTAVSATTGACVLCENQTQGGKGWLGTIGAGYDLQFSPKFVVGIFGDASLSSLKGTVQDQNVQISGDIKQTSSWAFGARAGLLTTSQTMSYFNAGYTGARFSGANMVTSGAGIFNGNSTPAFTASGWFLGGGVETAVSPGWFWRNEYRYAYYGSKTLTDTGTVGVLNNITFRPTVQTVTSQLVYKFNGGRAAPVYPATAAMATNWTGFYANAGVGYGLWNADTTTVNPVTGLCSLCVTQVQGGKGYLGRIGVGYDWQFAPAWVAGVLGDFDVSSLKGTVQDQGNFVAGAIKQTSAWAVGPRLGWLPSSHTMTYVNGGYTGARFSGTTMNFTNTGAPSEFVTPGLTTSGWFLGGGVETKFDLFGRGWFWRNEYRYASYGSKTLTDTLPGVGAINSITFKPTVQTVMSEIVFKFN
jgi:outer membrane immunogenic protein